MISDKFVERFLRDYRFRMVKPYLKGDVLDFGGNNGELGLYVKGRYVPVNYDHSVMKGKFDTIVSLATIEHLYEYEIYTLFKKFRKMLGGYLFITTPTRMSKPVLEFMAWLGLTDKENIAEHKHYWTKSELLDLARTTGFEVVRYKKFQLGFNQIMICK